MSTEAQNWIARTIKDLNINDKMTEDDVVEKVLDLIADVPDGLINEVAREISLYAVDKQKEFDRLADETDENDEETDDDEEETENVQSVGDIQNAYNEIHEMMSSNREPPDSILEYFRKWSKTAFEVDKWGWMLLHHMITRRVNVKLIEAVAKENPEALCVGVGVAHHTPIQLAARCCRPLEVIKALYDADPKAIRIHAPNGDSAHMLACRAKADMDVRVFLYVNRDGPIDDDNYMPDLIPISPPDSDADPDAEEREHNNGVAPAVEDDFVAEFVRTIGMKEAYPVMVILIAWITMLTLSLLAGVRIMV